MAADRLIISKENLLKFVSGMRKNSKVFAMQKNEFGDVAFLPVEEEHNILLKAHKPLMPSAREVLFGQIEPMIEFEKVGNTTKLRSVDQTEETVLFGLPNCDAAAIKYTDNFFSKREFIDFYYNRAREKLTLITMACLTPPSESCFCATMKTGPFAENGFDLQLTDMENGDYFVNVGSEKGSFLISENSSLFRQAKTDEVKLWESKKEKAMTLPVATNFTKEIALENMMSNPVKEKVLEEITDRCLSCGACNYVCPTCTCFNVKDLQKDDKGLRMRVIDSCILSGYFRMAGGHNPKERKEQRTRNRYYCKILWDKLKFGDTGCVGCGRCYDSCPVKIDIKEVFQSLM
ncbi:4Fe-4S dicluster domain-containing protein [candidate division WOR-3 bacterium]|nr:4Fe-4S dicluster domain-containing protein [candidate division WOR-3 bacterium]